MLRVSAYLDVDSRRQCDFRPVHGRHFAYGHDIGLAYSTPPSQFTSAGRYGPPTKQEQPRTPPQAITAQRGVHLFFWLWKKRQSTTCSRQWDATHRRFVVSGIRAAAASTAAGLTFGTKHCSVRLCDIDQHSELTIFDAYTCSHTFRSTSGSRRVGPIVLGRQGDSCGSRQIPPFC